MYNKRCDYVSDYYGVPARIGRRVVACGKPGVIAEDRGNYIGVNFDEDKPGVIHNCHPVHNVEYCKMGKIRKMTRSQKNYQKYLRVADCYESFSHYLGCKDAALCS